MVYDLGLSLFVGVVVKTLAMALPVLVFSLVFVTDVEKFELSNTSNITDTRSSIGIDIMVESSRPLINKISDIKSLLVKFNIDIEREDINRFKFVSSLNEKKRGYICHDIHSGQNLDVKEGITFYSITCGLTASYHLVTTSDSSNQGLKNRDLSQDKVPDGRS